MACGLLPHFRIYSTTYPQRPEGSMMIPLDGTPVVGLAGACARAIDADLSCAIGRERNRAMGHRPDCGGKSILEMFWDELLSEMDGLMPGGEYAEDARPKPSASSADHDLWLAHRARLRGVCQGISACIAILVNPYAPNVDAVRTEARSRWEAFDAQR